MVIRTDEDPYVIYGERWTRLDLRSRRRGEDFVTICEGSIKSTVSEQRNFKIVKQLLFLSNN